MWHRLLKQDLLDRDMDGTVQVGSPCNSASVRRSTSSMGREENLPVFTTEHKGAVQRPIEDLAGRHPEQGSCEGVGVFGEARLLVCYALGLSLEVPQRWLL